MKQQEEIRRMAVRVMERARRDVNALAERLFNETDAPDSVKFYLDQFDEHSDAFLNDTFGYAARIDAD